jgi:tetratricopeptide (TPR) repeat protein
MRETQAGFNRGKLYLVDRAGPQVVYPEPLSALAIGNITFDGKHSNRCSRIKSTDDYLIIDNSYCFRTELIRQPSKELCRVWVRVPGFSHLLNSKQNNKLESVSQLNDLCCLEQNCMPLHSLYYSHNKSFHSISLSPRPRSKAVSVEDYQKINMQISELEDLISAGDLELPQQKLKSLLNCFPCHPRIVFDWGAVNFCLGNYDSAGRAFHQAAVLGHPDGLEAEWATSSYKAQSFREKHSEAFDHIQNGEPLRSLTVLRTLKKEAPLLANAALAYCLRGANEPLEGMEAAAAALQCDPHQSDVYGHLWSYFTELEQDQRALEVARLHLHHYPLNPQAYIDALDSALLLGRTREAWWYCQGYLLQAVNLNTALKNLFKYYEYCRNWDKLGDYFSQIMEVMRAPTPATLTQYGETLIEQNKFSQAFTVLERALMADPGSTTTVLAYGRALAQSNQINEAIKFIYSVLGDKNRIDSDSEYFLLVAFLSELLRNSGQLPQALKLWPPEDWFDMQLLQAIGPRPFVEYVYCQAENNNLETVAHLTTMLTSQHQNDFIVQQLCSKLNEAGLS